MLRWSHEGHARSPTGTFRLRTGGKPLLNVSFWGVRGSTPCPCDENRRYGGNTACVALESPGMDPIVLDLGTGLRFWGGTLPQDGSFRGTALVTHLHWDHVQGLPFFAPINCPGARLDIYAPRPVRRGVGRGGVRGVHAPAVLPRAGHRPVRRHPVPRRRGRRAADRQGDRHGRRRPARRRDQRLPGRDRRRVDRLHQRPPAAARGRRRRAVGHRALPRRRPRDPRRAVPARRLRGQEQLGPLHGRVRGARRRRVGGPSPRAVPPRSRPSRRRGRRARSTTPASSAPSWDSKRWSRPTRG